MTANTLTYREFSRSPSPKNPDFAELPCFFPGNREFTLGDGFAEDCLQPTITPDFTGFASTQATDFNPNFNPMLCGDVVLE